MNRIRCCVPYCRHTRENPNDDFLEWICGDHWRAIPFPRRKAYARIKRRWRRFHDQKDGIRGARLWASVKRTAIEAAGGLR